MAKLPNGSSNSDGRRQVEELQEKRLQAVEMGGDPH